MENSILIQLLKCLSEQELDEIPGFILSPFCFGPKANNSRKTISKKKIMELYHVLKDQYPEYNNQNLNKKEVFGKVYGNEEFNDDKLRNIMYELSKVIQSYLSIKSLYKAQIEYKLHYIKELKQRDIQNLFHSGCKSVSKLIDLENKDEFFYYYKYLLNLHSWEFDLHHSDVNTSHKTMQSAMENLTHFYATALFEHIIQHYHNREFYNLDLFEPMYEEIYNIIASHKEFLAHNLDLSILQKFISLETNKPNKKILMDLVLEIQKNEHKISLNIFKGLTTLLSNMLFSEYFHDKIGYKEITTNFFQYCFEKEASIEGPYLNHNSYYNLSSQALWLQKPELAEQIINDYKGFLQPEFKEDTFCLSYANFYVLTKEFDKALSFLRRVKRNDYYFGARKYILLLRIYYETSALDDSTNLIDSFRHFLSNNKSISKEYLFGCKQFLKYYEKLFKLKLGESKLNPEELLLSLEKEKGTFCYDWLQCKIIELNQNQQLAYATSDRK